MHTSGSTLRCIEAYQLRQHANMDCDMLAAKLNVPSCMHSDSLLQKSSWFCGTHVNVGAFQTYLYHMYLLLSTPLIC